MRITSFIFGCFGAVLGAFQGIKWLSDLSSESGRLAQSLVGSAGKLGQELTSFKTAAYVLLICAFVGLVFSLLTLMKKGLKIVNVIGLILAGLLPIFISTQAFLGVPMVIGGLLGLTVKYNQHHS